jgi:hypothetical protein
MPTTSQNPETIVLHAGYRSDPTTPDTLLALAQGGHGMLPSLPQYTESRHI